MTLFYLNYLFKVPIPKYSTLILRYQELELQYRSVEEQNSACNGLLSLQSATEALENKSFSVPPNLLALLLFTKNSLRDVHV